MLGTELSYRVINIVVNQNYSKQVHLVQSNIVLYLARQKGMLYFGSQQLLKKEKKKEENPTFVYK